MLHLVWAIGHKTVLGARAQLRMRAQGQGGCTTYSTEHATWSISCAQRRANERTRDGVFPQKQTQRKWNSFISEGKYPRKQSQCRLLLSSASGKAIKQHDVGRAVRY